MLGKRATGQGLVMVSKRGQRPSSKSIDDLTMAGLTNLDGGQCSRRGATDNTVTKHQQKRRRCSDVGRGCSDSDGGGKGDGRVAAALVVAAMAATTTTVIGAARASTAAIVAGNKIFVGSGCHQWRRR